MELARRDTSRPFLESVKREVIPDGKPTVRQETPMLNPNKDTLKNMRESIFEALRSGALLLAEGKRQVRTQQIAYGRRMQEEGRLAWSSPDILTWSAWLARCWDEFSTPSLAANEVVARTLLSQAQEAKLWEDIIRKSAFGDALLQSHTTAQTVEEAWSLSWEWDIALPSVKDAPNEDARAFATWARDFDKQCRTHGWHDRGRLADTLGKAFASGQLNTPAKVLLLGFGELTHQQERLLEALRGRGTMVEVIETPPSPHTVIRYELDGPLDEIAAAAQWARNQMEAGASRIGVIVPDLGSLRPQVVRIFDDTFIPSAVLPSTTTPVRPYNISLGQALSQYPAIHTALQILELGKGHAACEEVGSLLRSPFIGGAVEEWARRALLDVACRQGEPLVIISGLLRLARDKDENGQWRAHSAPILATRLKEWRSRLDTFPKNQLPSAWAEGFAKELMALGWPGDRPLDSEEYQTVEAWRELLSELSSLDEVTDRMNYTEALLTLKRMAAERIFQPQSPEVPVQVMGLLEAAGLVFDRLWITGLDDATWPGSPRPNPFIPIELQRRHNLPHASAARELEFARRLTALLLSGAPHVIVSHPLRDGDEDLRPSPLIGHLPAEEPEALGAIGAFPRLVHESRPPFERIADERAPALATGSEVRLGTSVFKDQAACPFRAFAHARLGARALDEPEPGLDALGRGILLHSAMERVWRTLESHARLCSFSEAALGLAVQEAVVGAITEMAHDQPQTFTARFTALEQDRIESLVSDWLEIEKQRAPFTVVHPEKDRTASFGGLTIRMVPDRVDALDDGTHVVIDYKTGTPKLSQWLGDRPDEPQLPLYAMIQENLSAVAFAQIRKEDMQFLGVAAFADLLPNVRTVADSRETKEIESWQSLLAEWRRVIEALGEAFRAGDAQVAPKNRKTCEYCELGPLCRIREHEEPSPDDAEDAT
ncbi:MAG: PD-(D/E)XK nuclease family protein [Gammaproteobacteria bacterium]